MSQKYNRKHYSKDNSCPCAYLKLANTTYAVNRAKNTLLYPEREKSCALL